MQCAISHENQSLSKIFCELLWIPSRKKLSICHGHNLFKTFHQQAWLQQSLIIRHLKIKTKIKISELSNLVIVQIYMSYTFFRNLIAAYFFFAKMISPYLTYCTMICHSWEHTRLIKQLLSFDTICSAAPVFKQTILVHPVIVVASCKIVNTHLQLGPHTSQIKQLQSFDTVCSTAPAFKQTVLVRRVINVPSQ